MTNTNTRFPWLNTTQAGGVTGNPSVTNSGGFSPGAGPQYVTPSNPNGLPPFLKLLSGVAGRVPVFQVLNGVQAAARGKFMTDTPIGRLLTKMGLGGSGASSGGTAPGPSLGAPGGVATPGTVFAGYDANGNGLQYNPATGQTSVIPRAEAVNGNGTNNIDNRDWGAFWGSLGGAGGTGLDFSELAKQDAIFKKNHR